MYPLSMFRARPGRYLANVDCTTSHAKDLRREGVKGFLFPLPIHRLMIKFNNTDEKYLSYTEKTLEVFVMTKAISIMGILIKAFLLW